MTGRLDGKTALVTGGGRGIGRAIAERFASEGAMVMACGRSARPGDLDAGIDWQRCDLGEVGEIRKLGGAVQERWKQLDILVNNAGLQVEKTVVDTTDAEWDEVMGVNMRAVFMLCRECIPHMRGGGSIINIGSISGMSADPSMALYNASKAFVHGLTRSIAVDHGAQGVRCNAICPGWIETGMADAAFDLAKDKARARKDALARHAVGRIGQPSDIAGAALYLACDDAAFVTGQTFTVDGGLTAASPVRPGLF